MSYLKTEAFALHCYPYTHYFLHNNWAYIFAYYLKINLSGFLSQKIYTNQVMLLLLLIMHNICWKEKKRKKRKKNTTKYQTNSQFRNS